MSLLLNDAEKMDRDSKLTERILNLTLEIIHLLTGEDYILTKKMFDKDKEWSKHQTPITLSPSLKNKRSNVQKILVITNKITELLTGEVPIRCQDVTVYFSMEEWDYLEEHKDLYRDIVMEEHKPPVSKESIIKNVPEEPSTIPQSCSEENSEVLEDDQVDGAEMPPNAVEYLTTIKGEVMSRDEEIYEVVIQQCKEEEIPVDISPDDRTKTLEEHLLLAPDYTADYYDTYGAHCITTNIPSTFHSRDLSSDPTSYMEPSSDQSQNEQQVTGHRGDDCTKTQEEHHLSPDCEAEYNNIPQYNFINTHKVSVLHKRDLYSYPNIHKESASDESQNDQQVTGDRGVKIFTCTECGKQFKKKLSFYAHRRNHRSGKPFSCSDCGKSFKNKSDLTRHQRIHSGVKPFSCSECGKCFTVKSHLVDHQKIHTGEKPFSCSECGNCFARKSNLQRHQRTHTGVKAYYCSECGKSFTMKSDFIDHQKTHIVEKPFSCLQCGKCFTLKAELIGHMRIHTEEKQYTCPDCGKCFTQKLALVNHQQLHSDEVCMFRL